MQWLRYGPRARSLPHLLHSHRLVLTLTPDPTRCLAAACRSRVPGPRTHVVCAPLLTTTLLLQYYSHCPFIHERTAPRDLGPLITDPLRSPLPSPVNGQRTPPSDKRHSSLRPTPHIPLQNHLDANVISYKPKLFIRLNRNHNVSKSRSHIVCYYSNILAASNIFGPPTLHPVH